MNLENIYELSAIIGDLKVLSPYLEEMKKNPIFRVGSFLTPLTNKTRREFLKLAKDINEELYEIQKILQELSITEETQIDVELVIEKLDNFSPDNSFTHKQAFDDLAFILKEIEKDSAKWEDRIVIELTKIPILIPYLKGLLNPNKLLQGAKSFFENEDHWNKIQDIEKEDLEDFLHCYLNKAWTPAGIMAMRVIESAMRFYYTKVTNGKIKKNWYKILDDLRTNYRQESDEKLISLLDYIRKNIRNPLAHPEERITSQESELVFQQALQVLARVYG